MAAWRSKVDRISLIFQEIVDKAKKKAEKLEKKVKKEEKKQRKAEKKLNKATKKELKKQLKMQRDLGILSEEDDSEDDTDTDPVPKSLLKTENQYVGVCCWARLMISVP